MLGLDGGNCSRFVQEVTNGSGVTDVPDFLEQPFPWFLPKSKWFDESFLEKMLDFGKWFNDAFGLSKCWQPPRDPLILDLDGNGLETVGLAANIHFDHDGDGVLTKTGWVGKDDALLVWDRNANGRIDTGAELFGDFTPLPNGTLAPNGFAALAALDSNGDDTYLFGRSDGQDTVIDGDYTAGNSDTLRFKEGVALADVRKSRRWRGGECANDEMRRVAA